MSLQPSTEANGGKPKGRVATNIMMELRKACNHPYLFWYHERPEMPGATELGAQTADSQTLTPRAAGLLGVART